MATLRRVLFSLLFLLSAGAPSFPQAITPPGGATNAGGQVIVTTNYLYYNKMRFAGTWSALTTYGVQDVVIYSGAAFVSLTTANLNATPSANSASWTLIGGSLTASITLTAAQINTMFTSPVLFIPAQGAGTVINVQRCVYNAIFGSAAFTGGGSIGQFFGLVSPPVTTATGTLPATFLTTFSANQILSQASMSMTVNSLAVNAAVYVSNQTGVFAGGTGSSMIVSCQYSVVAGVH